MRVFVPDITEFFTWLEASGHKYVVLRRFYEFDSVYPNIAPKHELDMLAEDAVLPAIQARYGQHKKGQGVECDIYNVSGLDKGGELGIPYFPPELANEILTNRRLWKERFYVPAARDHFLSLLYHLCYRKAEASGMDWNDASKSASSKYIAELELLKKELGIELPNTLEAFQHYLRQANYTAPYSYLPAILQDQFRRHVKSYCLARAVAEEYKGELNLFVIRGVALKKKLDGAMLDALKKHYQILAVKPIPFLTRLLKSGEMRGGKWRRGGRPHIAVVVYDPHPQPTTDADRKVHPFVFNNRQFFKPALREWFTKEARTNPKSNPLHSTDNEAEAIGHLNLFFTPEEQQAIVDKVTALRKEQL